MSESVYTRMREKEIVLPKALAPVGLYLPVQQTGNLVFISGQGCIEDGVHLTGRAGADVTVEEAARRAEICMKNTLAALEGYLGTLDPAGGGCQRRLPAVAGCVRRCRTPRPVGHWNQRPSLGADCGN